MSGSKCVGQGRAAACLLKFPGRHCWKWCFLWIIFVFIWFDLNLGALHKEKQATVWQELVGKMKWKWHWQEHYRKTHHSVTGFTDEFGNVLQEPLMVVLLLLVKANELCKGHKRTFLILRLIAENPESCLHFGLWNLYAIMNIMNHSVQTLLSCVMHCSFHGVFMMT